MKPAVRILSLLLALCLMLSAVPFAALAEGEEAPAVCQDCQRDPCICCPDCEGTTEDHAAGCIRTCLGGEVCVDGVHTSDCPLSAPVCDGYDGCVDGGHSSDCRLFVCPECGGKGKTHTGTCPTLCTYQPGCGDGKHADSCPLYICGTCQQKPCVCGEPNTASEKALASIALTTQPRTAYTCGESLDVTGGRLTLSYDDESTEEISLTAEMVTGFDSAGAGEKTLTVTYGGFTTAYAITVSSAPEGCPTQTNAASDGSANTDMYLYTDSFGGNIWTSYDDIVGYDAVFAMKHGNPDNPAITNTVTQDKLVIVTSSEEGVITPAQAENGSVHYKLQKVGYADLALDQDGPYFRINVHKFLPDRFYARDGDGALLSNFYADPGTYTLTFGVTSWAKSGREWTPDNDVFTPVEPTVEEGGSGVNLVKGENNTYTVTIASGGSAAVSYGTGEDKKTITIADQSILPITIIRYTQDGMQTLTGGQDVTIPASVNTGFPLYIGKGENNPVPLSALSVEPAEQVSLSQQDSGPGNVLLLPKETGDAQVYYTNAGGEKSLIFTLNIGESSGPVLEPGTMLVKDAASTTNMLFLEPGTPSIVTICVIQNDGSLKELNPDILYSTSDLIQIERVSADSNQVRITMSEDAKGWIRYSEDILSEFGDGFPWLPLEAQAWGVGDNGTGDYAANLFICDPDGSNPRSSVTMKPGDEMTVSLRYGGTMASLPVTTLFGGSSNTDSVTITKNKDGTFTIKALAVGTSVISHKDAENGSGAAVSVVSTRAEDKMLFHKKGGFYGVDVVPYLNIQAGTTDTLRLYFGDAASSVEVTENVTTSGNVSIQKNAGGGGYDITASSAGTGLIEYTKDGIVYTMSVWITENGNGDGGNYEARNAIRIGNTTYATAQLESESLTITPGTGADYEPGITTRGFAKHVVLAAMDSTGDVNADAFGNISDVSIKFLACVDENDDVTPTTNATIASRTTPTVPQTNVTTWGAVVQAEAQKGFHSLVAISFTLQDGGNLRRCTVMVNVSYVSKAGNVTIYTNDLDTAAELNVVLSSYEAFTRWLNDKDNGKTVNGNFALGGNIQLVLPAGDFTDGIVVAQMISDVVQNTDKTPISHMTITGSADGTTKMAGMVYKGGVSLIQNIDFVANRDLTMLYGGDAFTCGILADYTYASANDAAWDQTYADKYCPDDLDTMAECLSHNTHKLNTVYSANLLWGNVEIYNLDSCTFEGFDYGVRSTPYGMVGSGHGNTFEDCFYGIYMDSYGMGVSTNNPHHTDYNNCRFVNNAFALRLVSLPGEVSPYNFRVHDSTFLHNHREFWIRPRGDYYFYRNYYGGHWRDHDHRGHWHHFKDRYSQFVIFDDWDRGYQNHDGHRPGRYHLEGSDSGVRIITTAARIDGYDGRWIYDREDQHNRFLEGEQNIAIDQGAIDALEKDTKVTVVARDPDSGTTTDRAVITFRGKGEH